MAEERLYNTNRLKRVTTEYERIYEGPAPDQPLLLSDGIECSLIQGSYIHAVDVVFTLEFSCQSLGQYYLLESKSECKLLRDIWVNLYLVPLNLAATKSFSSD